jgi:dephospho-CoA kinase
MLIVGLTGGIGSGKSTVAELFAAHGVPYIDADHLAREAVAPGSPLLATIAAEYGDDLLAADGSLDRRTLRARAFADPAVRKRLEQLLHPEVYRLMRARVAALDAPYCLLVIPLLAETGAHERVHRVLVVDVDEADQVARTAARDDADREQVTAILRSQATRAARLALADDVIDNRGSAAALGTQVERLHRAYLQLAATRDWPSPFPAPA